MPFPSILPKVAISIPGPPLGPGVGSDCIDSSPCDPTTHDHPTCFCMTCPSFAGGTPSAHVTLPEAGVHRIECDHLRSSCVGLTRAPTQLPHCPHRPRARGWPDQVRPWRI